MNFSAAIFDLDGTLIDSNPIWKKLDEIILKRFGIFATNDFLDRLAAMTYEEAAFAMQQIGANITIDEFKDEINALAVHEYSNNIHLKNGVFDYLNYLRKSGIKISLATASPPWLYEPVLKKNNVYDMFDAFTTTDEVGLNKSYPDIYITAASKVNSPPNRCIAFEDVLNGVNSAKKTGMYVVGVYDESSSAEFDKIKSIADKFIYSFNEML